MLRSLPQMAPGDSGGGGPTTAMIAAALRQALADGRQTALTITSNSMAPLLRAGDRVVVAPADGRDLLAGDIVVVETPVALLTHRYYETRNLHGQPHLLLRGDRPLHYDRPLPVERLVGIVVARRRVGRSERLLSLQEGGGRRLNRRLARLAGFEARRWAAVPAPLAETEPAVMARPAPQGPTTRVARKLIYLWAVLLTAAVR